VRVEKDIVSGMMKPDQEFEISSSSAVESTLYCEPQWNLESRLRKNKGSSIVPFLKNDAGISQSLRAFAVEA